MNHSMVIFVSIFLLSSLSTYGVTTTDLDTTYRQAQQILSDDTTFLQSISDSEQVNRQKNDLIQQISTAKDSIKEIYDRALQYIKPALQMPASAQSTNLITTQVTNALAQINRAQTLITNQINQFKAQINWQTAKSSAVQQTAQQAAEQQKLFEKMRQLMASVTPAINQMQQAESMARKVALQFKIDGSYVSQDIQAVVDQYAAAARQAAQAYQKAAQSLNAQDATNTVTMIIRQLINFMNELMKLQVERARGAQRSPLLYQQLSFLAQRIVGNAAGTTALDKQGYTANIRTLITSLFADSSPLIQWYVQAMVNTTLSSLRSGLAQGAAQLHEPTAEQTAFMQKIYDALVQELSYVRQSETVLAEIANNLAIVYVNYATTLLTKVVTPETAFSNVVVQARDAFKQASALFTQGGRSAPATTYGNMAQALTQGLSSYTTAQQSAKVQSLDQALSAYNAAQTSMKAGGNMAAVGVINSAVAALTAQVEQQKGVAQLQAVVTNSSAAMTALLQLMQADGTRDLASFVPTLKTLSATAKAVAPLYQTSIDAYGQLSTLSVQETLQLKTISTAYQALQALSSGIDLLVQADQNARDLLAGSLNAADLLYQKAQEAFSIVDKALADKTVDAYVPLSLNSFAANVQLAYGQLAADYMAYLYVWLADSIRVSQSVLALQYYSSAHNKQPLSPSMQTLVQTRLTAFEQQKVKIQDLFNQAQNNEKLARSLSVDQWNSTAEQFYESPASILWKSVLTDYWTTFKLGYMPALGAFTNAVLTYASLYENNVPETYFSKAQSAFIFLEAVAANGAFGDTAQSQDILRKEVLPRLTQFFDVGQQLINAVNSTSVVPTVTASLEELRAWDTYATQAVQQQPLLVTTYGSQQTDALLLMSLNIKQDGSHVYTLLPANRILTIAPYTLMSAQVYQRLADFYFNQKNYGLARESYKKSIDLLHDLQQSTQASALQSRFDLSTTLYYATYYASNVEKSSEIVSLSSWQVPLKYSLLTYALMVPSDLAKLFPPNLEQIKTNPAQLIAFDIATAVQTFIYYSVEFLFGRQRINELFSVVTAAVQGTAQPTWANFSAADAKYLKLVIANAQTYQKDVTQRIANRTSNIVIEGMPPKDDIPQFKLWESHKPIPKLPMISPPYQGYPSAYIYYLWSMRLFGPSPVTLGTLPLVPGNQPDQVARMQDELIKIWLSAGYESQQQIDLLKKSKDFIQAAGIDRSATNVTLTNYLPLFNQIRTAYLSDDASSSSLIVNYHAPISQNLVATGTPSYTALLALLAQVSKQAGDDLATFLFGDPLSPDYYTVITTVAKFYIDAIESFGYSALLYGTLADLYRTAASRIKQQENYFGSIANFALAQQLYKKVVNPPASIVTRLRQTAQEQLTTEFYGATNNVNLYTKQRFGTVTVQSDSGTSAAMPFDTFITKYRMSLNDNSSTILSVAEQEAIEKLKNLLLDSLIFYADSGTELAAQLPVKNAADQSVLDKKAEDLVQKFMQNNKIAFDDIQGMLTFLQRSESTELIKQGFDSFMSSVTNTDTNQQYTGIKAASVWANKLYIGVGLVYMNDFLGGVSAQTWVNLNTAVKARLFSIQANPTQSIG